MSSIRPLHIFGLVLIVGFGIFSFTGLKGAVTPYVDIATAKATADRVQVKGQLDKSSLHAGSHGELLFTLQDFKTHEKFDVVYTGPQPANMQMARDVVTMGTWDPGRGVFQADQMNIKCPDKYAAGTGASPDASSSKNGGSTAATAVANKS